jgi:hypothetical protein
MAVHRCERRPRVQQLHDIARHVRLGLNAWTASVLTTIALRGLAAHPKYQTKTSVQKKRRLGTGGVFMRVDSDEHQASGLLIAMIQ